jgi:hypothetical protein
LRCALVIVRDESGRLFLDNRSPAASALRRPPLIFHQAGRHVKRYQLFPLFRLAPMASLSRRKMEPKIAAPNNVDWLPPNDGCVGQMTVRYMGMMPSLL